MKPYGRMPYYESPEAVTGGKGKFLALGRGAVEAAARGAKKKPKRKPRQSNK